MPNDVVETNGNAVEDFEHHVAVYNIQDLKHSRLIFAVFQSHASNFLHVV